MTSNNNDFNLDYERIREKVSENIEGATGGKKVKKRGVLQSLKYAACVLLSAAVTLGATLTIQGFSVNNNETNDIAPGMFSCYVEEFDEFVAFGGYGSELISSYKLFRSDLISEEAKNELTEYEKNEVAERAKKKVVSCYYTCYLGVKDGEDKVLIKSHNAPYDYFIFDCPLKYPVTAIVKAFKDKYGIEDHKTKIMVEDNRDKYNISDIEINLKESNCFPERTANDHFIEFYSLEIDKMLYLISSDEINI